MGSLAIVFNKGAQTCLQRIAAAPAMALKPEDVSCQARYQMRSLHLTLGRESNLGWGRPSVLAKMRKKNNTNAQTDQSKSCTRARMLDTEKKQVTNRKTRTAETHNHTHTHTHARNTLQTREHALPTRETNQTHNRQFNALGSVSEGRRSFF